MQGLTVSQKYNILFQGLPITNELSAFRAEDFIHMNKLTKPDQIINLVRPDVASSISSEDLRLYIAVREEYLAKDSLLDKLKFIAKGSKSYPVKNIKLENLDALPLSLLSSYLRINFPDEKRFKNTLFWEEKVAVDEDIIRDLKVSGDGFNLLPPTLLSNLTPRAVVGHAQNGHSTFSSTKIAPNTSLDDIISENVLTSYFDKKGKPFYDSTYAFLHETQNYINSFAHLIDVATNPKVTSSKMDLKKSPMFGFDFLKNLPFDSYAFLKGLFFGGYFDNYSTVRKGVKAKYGTDMGGGRTYLINKSLLKGLGISIHELTSGKYKDPVLKRLSYDKRMSLFSHIGLIKNDSELDYKNANSWNDILDQASPVPEGYFQEYIREQPGPGGSDDLLCMGAAFIDFKPENIRRDPLWYLWLQMGSRGADFVDTLTKATEFYLPGGQDEVLAKYANAAWLKKLRTNKYYASEIGINLKKLERDLDRAGSEEFALVSLNELVDITAAGINPSRAKFKSTGDSSIHSSARYFVKQQNSFKDYTNFNKSYPTKGITNTLDQQLFATFKYLKKAGANVEYSDKQFIYPLESNTKVGFQQHLLPDVINYFSKQLFPILKNPLDREKLLKKFFKNY